MAGPFGLPPRPPRGEGDCALTVGRLTGPNGAAPSGRRPRGLAPPGDPPPARPSAPRTEGSKGPRGSHPRRDPTGSGGPLPWRVCPVGCRTGAVDDGGSSRQPPGPPWPSTGPWDGGAPRDPRPAPAAARSFPHAPSRGRRRGGASERPQGTRTVLLAPRQVLHRPGGQAPHPTAEPARPDAVGVGARWARGPQRPLREGGPRAGP